MYVFQVARNHVIIFGGTFISMTKPRNVLRIVCLLGSGKVLSNPPISNLSFCWHLPYYDEVMMKLLVELLLWDKWE